MKQANAKHIDGSELSMGKTVLFLTEDQLAQSVGEGEWMKPGCGHDCCTCDQECK